MKDTLNNLLQGWASQAEAPEARVSQIRDRIAREVRDNPSVSPTEASAFCRSSRFWDRLLFIGLGAAAACLALLLLPSVTSPERPAVAQPSRPMPSPAVSSYLAQISESELKANTVLFQEVNELFADELRWIFSSTDTRLGIRRPVAGVTDDRSPIFLRIAFLCRRSGDHPWEKSWVADVLVRNEEMVDVGLGRGDAERLSLWVYRTDDGMIIVDSSLTMTQPLKLSTHSVDLLRPGVPAEVLALKTEGLDYRVVEVARVLKAPGGGAL